MGSKNSVFKRNKTTSNQNGKTTIQNVLKKRNPVCKENISEETCVPNCVEKEKDQRNMAKFRKTPSETQSDCTHSAICLKDKVYDSDINIKGNPISVNALADTAEKANGSEINSAIDGANVNDLNLQPSVARSGNGLQLGSINDRNIKEIHGSSERDLSISFETELTGVEEDPPDRFDFKDELYFLLGGNFTGYHPASNSNCITPVVSDGILNDVGENQPLVSCNIASKKLTERKFGMSQNDLIKRLMVSTSCSITSRTSGIMGPRSLNVAIVKGMIYRREVYGPPISQTGEAGPSQQQVPIGVEEYMITKHYSYGKDGTLTTDSKPFGCPCDSWGKDSRLNPPPNTEQLPVLEKSLKKEKSSSSVTKGKKKKSAKGKRGTSESLKKKGKKSSMAKDGSVKKDSSKKVTSKKNTPKKPTSPKSPTMPKETPSKRKGKISKNVAKGVKKPAAKKSVKTFSNDDDDESSDSSDEGEKPSVPTVPKKAKTNAKPSKPSKPSKPLKPSLKKDIKKTEHQTNKTDAKSDQNDEKYLFVNLEKSGQSNVRVGVSRTDHSGYDIMFKDEGDMKVKVEKIVSGKNRVFTYNSGNETQIRDEEIKQIEAKTTQTIPPEHNEKQPLIGVSQKQAKKLIKINVKVPKNLEKQQKVAKGKPTGSEAVKSDVSVANTKIEQTVVNPKALPGQRETHFVHPSAHHEKEDGAKRDSRIYEREGRKMMSPTLVHESLEPIFGKFYPRDDGFNNPNYIADVQTDKCTVDGNKIECLTNIPRVKVVFDVPDTHGRKLETTKPKIAISQYDIQVDVGLDRMNQKYLDQMSHKAGRYDSILSNENVFVKADDGQKTQTKVPNYTNRLASIYSLDSEVNNPELLNKKNLPNEPNKFKSKLYDANRLLEIKECLSKMRLELRNDCPCLASRHEDRLENKDKNIRTDRVIIIRTKRKDGGEECSDDSDSEEEKVKEEALHELANQLLEKNRKKDNRRSNVSDKYVVENEANGTKGRSRNVQDKKNPNTFSEGSEEINVDSDSSVKQNVKSKNVNSKKPGRFSDEESINHPELSELNSNEDETEFRGRRKRAPSIEKGRSIWDHPESTVTEEEALLTKSIMKGARNKRVVDKLRENDDSHVGFRNASKETSDMNMKRPSFRNRHPTGIFFQGQNLLAGSNYLPTSSESIESGKFSSKEGLATVRDNESSENFSNTTEMNSNETLNQRLSAESKKKNLAKNKSTKDGRIAFNNANDDGDESVMKRHRKRQNTGVFHQGRKLLNEIHSDENSTSQFINSDSRDSFTGEKNKTSGEAPNSARMSNSPREQNNTVKNKPYGLSPTEENSDSKGRPAKNQAKFLKNKGITADDSNEPRPPGRDNIVDNYPSSQMLDVEYSADSMYEPLDKNSGQKTVRQKGYYMSKLEDSSECLSTECTIRKGVRNEAIQKTSYGLHPNGKYTDDKSHSITSRSNSALMKLKKNDSPMMKNVTKLPVKEDISDKTKSGVDPVNKPTGLTNSPSTTAFLHPSALPMGIIDSSDDLDPTKSVGLESMDSKVDSENLPNVCRLKPNTKGTFRYSAGAKGVIKPNEGLPRIKSDALNSMNSKNSTDKNSESNRLKPTLAGPHPPSVQTKNKDYDSNDSLGRMKSDPSDSNTKGKTRPTICRLKVGDKKALLSMGGVKGNEEGLPRVKSDALSKAGSKSTDTHNSSGVTKTKSAYESDDSLGRMKSNPSETKTKTRPTICRIKSKDKEAILAANKSNDSFARAKSDALKTSELKSSYKKRSTACRLKVKEKSTSRVPSIPKVNDESSIKSFSQKKPSFIKPLEPKKVPRPKSRDEKAVPKLSTSSLKLNTSSLAVNLDRKPVKQRTNDGLKKSNTAVNNRKTLPVKPRKPSPENKGESGGVPIGKVWADLRLEKKVLTDRLNSIIKSLATICPQNSTGLSMRCCCDSTCLPRVVDRGPCQPRRRTSHSPRK